MNRSLQYLDVAAFLPLNPSGIGNVFFCRGKVSVEKYPRSKGANKQQTQFTYYAV
jgi:hypothetical protein